LIPQRNVEGEVTGGSVEARPPGRASSNDRRRKSMPVLEDRDARRHERADLGDAFVGTGDRDDVCAKPSAKLALVFGRDHVDAATEKGMNRGGRSRHQPRRNPIGRTRFQRDRGTENQGGGRREECRHRNRTGEDRCAHGRAPGRRRSFEPQELSQRISAKRAEALTTPLADHLE
jgi:hypothetical protein